MKKSTALLLALLLALSVAACAPKNDGPDATDSTDATDTAEDTSEDTAAPDTGKDTTEDTAAPDTTEDTPAPDTTGDTTEDTTGGTPGFGGPGFQIGPGGIVTPGQGGGSEGEDVPVADPGDLLDQLDALCADIVEGSYCAAPRSSADFSNYFGGKVQYTEGMRVAMNHLQMAPPAHIVMLIEVPAGEDAKAYAKNLNDNANPRWLVCATADSVQYAVKGNLVLFVMSNEDTANAVIAAFNG